MDNLMQQAQVMREKLESLQEDLKKQMLEVSSGGGMVKATINGEGLLQSITIDPAVVASNDIQMLQDLVVVAVNEAHRRLSEFKEEKMKELTGGFSLPGLF